MNKIEGFLKLIKDDKELQDIIKKVDSKLGKGKEEDQKVVEEEVIPLAKKNGFDFTAEEFLNYVDKAEKDLGNAISGDTVKEKKSKFGKIARLALYGVGGLGAGVAIVAAVNHFNQPKKADVAQVQMVETKNQEQENSDGHGAEGEEIKNDGLRSEEVKGQAPGEGKTSDNLKKELEKHNNGGQDQNAPAANAPAAEKNKNTPTAPPAMTKEKKIEMVNEMLDKIINNVDGALDKGVEAAKKAGQDVNKEQVVEEYKKLRDQGTDEQKLYLYNMIVSQMMGGGAGEMN